MEMSRSCSPIVSIHFFGISKNVVRDIDSFLPTVISPEILRFFEILSHRDGAPRAFIETGVQVLPWFSFAVY